MEALYYSSGIGVFLLMPAIVFAIVFFLIKPQKLQKKLGRTISRKRILSIGIVSALIVLLGFGGVMAATEPESVKQQRIEQRQAKEAALEEERAKEQKETYRLEEERRQREIKENLVEVKTETKEETIEFNTEERENANIPKGEKRISQEGENGTKTLTYKVEYRGGKEVSRKLVSKETTKAAVSHIVMIGTYTAPPPPPATAPAQQQSSAPNTGGVIKMSNSSICHAPGTTYYNRTTNFKPFNSLQDCLNAGGRLPLR